MTVEEELQMRATETGLRDALGAIAEVRNMRRSHTNSEYGLGAVAGVDLCARAVEQVLAKYEAERKQKGG